ncbi:MULTISPECIES: hypothetical protein [Acinetobacter calcoaceticus/baumannii complex]|uniref:Uncharacterized protein n=1 Tax=Acinetobacter seifertii TaxID=1530123 RepID=N8QVV5_9GAMM|nr:hypothetical protein [Acinetobacter seifertii]ENU42740.1 hypothetical protein F985_03632 [Acinetobacter seifertii]
MGTSTSSKGPNGKTPLVPSWANEQGGAIVCGIDNNLGDFRAYLGKAANKPSGPNGTNLRKAIGHYAKNATGGKSIAPKRYQKLIATGGSLFDLFKSIQVGNDYLDLKISDLNGQSIDIVIDKIIEHLLVIDGDSERIRASLNQSLAECLNGEEDFDFNKISSDTIIDLMLRYTQEYLFQQIILDSRAAFDKADTPENIASLEEDLHSLIKSSVDKHMSTQLKDGTNSLTRKDIERIQMKALEDIWGEWESYLND